MYTNTSLSDAIHRDSSYSPFRIHDHARAGFFFNVWSFIFWRTYTTTISASNIFCMYAFFGHDMAVFWGREARAGEAEDVNETDDGVRRRGAETRRCVMSGLWFDGCV